MSLKQRRSGDGVIAVGSGDLSEDTPSKKRRNESHTRGVGRAVGLVLVALLAGAALYYQQTVAQQTQDALQQKLSTSLSAIQDLESQLTLLKDQHKENKDSSDTLLQTKVDYLTKYKARIIKQIQELHHAQALKEFGPGPHRVEMLLAFDPASNVASDVTNAHRIVLELAPLNEMPHTVYWFLSQIKAGLYDGSSFHRNAGHVIQAGPVPNFATPPGARLAEGFHASGFESVLFQEYSEKFPHYKYTVGYAGRPGGPDFYISTLDNVKNHGPGGQGSYADPTEADPCFAKVVEGFDAVDRIHQSAVQEGGYRRMVHYVGISSLKLMTGGESIPSAKDDANSAAAAAGGGGGGNGTPERQVLENEAAVLDENPADDQDEEQEQQ